MCLVYIDQEPAKAGCAKDQQDDYQLVLAGQVH
jgi:hypothetical protein